MIQKLKQHKVDRTLLLILVITFLFFLYSFFIAKKDVISADGAGYYSYPYLLLKEGSLNHSLPQYQSIFGTYEFENGIYINKYPIGTGLFLFPAALASFTVSNISNTEYYIYSDTSNFFVGIFGILYLILGLFILKKILLHFFNKKTANLTLLLITLGTNLLIYGSVDASFSHIYSFLSVNLMILYTLKWNKDPSKINAIVLGFAMGLIILVRQSNIYLLLLPILYSFQNIKLQSSKKEYFKSLAVILPILFLTIVPQLVYWLTYANSILIYSYRNEGFNFLAPQLLNILFNINRGLLFWHPILIGALLGFSFKTEFNKKVLLLLIAISIYLSASWWQWDYSIGFGHRAFTDILGIFAIGLALSIKYTLKLARKYQVTIIILTLLLLAINFITSINYIQDEYNYKKLTIVEYVESIVNFKI